MKYCLNCFEQIDDNQKICPHCHYVEGTPPPKQQYLDPGAIFEDRYIIGTALGSGGFSVTYKAFDASLNKVVAIKEYFPMDVCTRAPHSEDVVIFSDEEKADAFEKGKAKFEEEAKRMARFQGVEHIVQVYDTIEANHTCYIVMEYLDGETLESYINRKGQIPEEEAINIIVPVLDALEKIHAQSMVHRDVSPSNIMLLKDGDVKLLDFGSARYTNADYSRSLTVLFKEGFTAEEQYYTNGHQGPWTDVYSVGATLYYMLTGVKVESALDRKVNDTIVFPSMIAAVHRNVETAIMNALTTDYRLRTQSAHDMKAELTSMTSVSMHYTRKSVADSNLIPKPLRIIAPVAIICLLVFMVAVSNGAFIHFDETYTSISNESTVPALVGLTTKEAKNKLKERGITADLNRIDSPYEESNTIVSQNVPAGSILSGKDQAVILDVATGSSDVLIPHYEGLNSQEYLKKLKKIGLKKIIIKERSSTLYANGAIISLEGEDDEEKPVNVGVNKSFNTANKLIVYVAKKEEKQKSSEKVTVPDLKGKSLNDDKFTDLKKNDLKLIVDRYVSNDEPAGTIVNQITKGQVNKGSVVHVVVSASNQSIKVPNVIGMKKKEAIQALKRAGVSSSQIKPVKQESTKVKKGLVVAQNGTENNLVSEAAMIHVAISEGFKVPDVVGESQKTAIPIIKTNGLKVKKHYAYHKGYKNGEVIYTTPSRSDYVSKGKTIDVYVMKSSDTIDADHYKGMSSQNVIDSLKKKGYTKFDTKSKHSDSVGSGKVISVSPSGKHKLNAKITVTVSLGSRKKTIQKDTTASSTKKSSQTQNNRSTVKSSSSSSSSLSQKRSSTNTSRGSSTRNRTSHNNTTKSSTTSTQKSRSNRRQTTQRQSTNRTSQRSSTKKQTTKRQTTQRQRTKKSNGSGSKDKVDWSSGETIV